MTREAISVLAQPQQVLPLFDHLIGEGEQ